MATLIDVHEAKTNLSRILERVHGGEEIILAKAGKPYVRLVPVRPVRKREPGLLKGKVTAAFFEPLPEEETEPLAISLEYAIEVGRLTTDTQPESAAPRG
jgi:prevent-host-death family protein